MSRYSTQADTEAWFEAVKTWGKWGERGALNDLTVDKPAHAAALIRDGYGQS